MPISNNGPFPILGGMDRQLRLFICEDGIVIVHPSFSRHLPGQLVAGFFDQALGGALGGLLGGGIGGAIEGAMGSKEYQEGDEKAKAVRFASAERLAASIPRSMCIPAGQVEAVIIKRRIWDLRLVTLVMQNRQLKGSAVHSLGSRKISFLLTKKDSPPVLTSLRELFGDRFQSPHDQ